MPSIPKMPTHALVANKKGQIIAKIPLTKKLGQALVGAGFLSIGYAGVSGAVNSPQGMPILPASLFAGGAAAVGIGKYLETIGEK